MLDDCNFHECVRLDEFDTTRTLSFIPPDGEFSVLNYRITGEFRAPFRIFPFFELVSPYKVELILKVRQSVSESYSPRVRAHRHTRTHARARTHTLSQSVLIESFSNIE